MSCYKDLYDLIIHKYGEDKLHEISEWAFAMLEQSDKRSYNQIMNKMEDLAYAVGLDDAREIVEHMKPHGQMWSYDKVKDFVATKGITDRLVDWYLAMNMAYNDYYSTAKIFGHQNDVEFFFHIAKDFLEDEDAKPHKVAKYFG